MSVHAIRSLQDDRRRQLPAEPDPPSVAYDPTRPLLAWLLAGDCRFTITSARTGQHRVFKVARTRRPHETGWSYFAWVRDGDPNPDLRPIDLAPEVHGRGVWTYVGELGPGRDGLWSHATAATSAQGSQALVALRWFLARVQAGWDGQDPTVPATLLKSTRCARCRRVLTDPDSIARGLGAECWDKATGGGQ
jgi:hypothetical protein